MGKRTKRLAEYVPNPDTRAWLRRVYSVSPDWAAELTRAFYEGALMDMGDAYPEVETQPEAQLDIYSDSQLELEL